MSLPEALTMLTSAILSPALSFGIYLPFQALHYVSARPNGPWKNPLSFSCPDSSSWCLRGVGLLSPIEHCPAAFPCLGRLKLEASWPTVRAALGPFRMAPLTLCLRMTTGNSIQDNSLTSQRGTGMFHGLEALPFRVNCEVVRSGDVLLLRFQVTLSFWKGHEGVQST